MPSLTVDKALTYRCLGNFWHLSTLLILSAVLGGKTEPVAAQVITPALDGTGTTVTQTGTQFNIEGGNLSANGDNLFHSFQNFQLESGERATFLTTPFIQSVFARISGGVPSLLNGELQLLGSDADLFFMNPAGIVFGPNATLNLPANFSATTADALGLGSHWFNATGANDYEALNAAVNAFAFTQSLPGSIINGGKLTLGGHHQLSLVGGRVINTGTLSTPGGTVTIAAVPGENIARISTEGQLLTLEIVEDPAKTTSQDFRMLGVNSSRARALRLPELLTFSGGPDVTQLIENPDGTISLSGSEIGIPVQTGTAIVSGSVDVSQPVNIQTANSQTADIRGIAVDSFAEGGGVGVFGDRVALLSTEINASGVAGGGTVLLGGDYQGQEPIYPARQTFIDGESTIAANALSQGNGGNVIAWATGTTQFFGNITATGAGVAGDGGFVEVSGKESLIFRGLVDVSAPHGETGSLLLDPKDIRIVDGDNGDNDPQIEDNILRFEDGKGLFTLSETTLESLAGNANITLQATNNIFLEELSDNELTFAPGAGRITWLADADQDGAGDLAFLDTRDAVVAAGRSLHFSGDRILVGSLETTAPNNDGGNITLQATNSIDTGQLSTQAPQGTGGSVTLSAGGTITTSDIHTAGLQSSGDIALTNTEGDIITGNILTETFGSSSTVTLSTPGDVFTGNVAASEFTANGESLETFEGQIEPKDTINLEDRPRDNRMNTGGKPRNSRLRGQRRIMHSSRTVLDSANAVDALSEIETARVQEFSEYFGRSLNPTDLSPEEIQSLLTEVQATTDKQSIVVYIKSPTTDTEQLSKSDSLTTRSETAPSETALELLIFTASQDPIQLTIPTVSEAQLLQTISEFRGSLVTSLRRGSTTYLPPAQQLYQWLIQPIEDELGPAAIDNILFSMDAGLRSVPIAALHDGEQFLIEKYSVGMVPSLALMDTDYQPMDAANVLAMGASTFESLQPLLAVPAELEIIGQLWQSNAFLNEQFTRENLVEQQLQSPAQIIHLATHAEFNAGNADNSYIQLWNERLYLSDIHTLGLGAPAVDLLVLSACQTALGNTDAEMGFAGLAVAAGAKSALASLWSVSDVGTLALMGEFYSHLKNSPVKSEALRQSQLAMLRGDIRIESGQLLSNNGLRSMVPLPSSLSNTTTDDLSHPYYWSGFTMIGNPW